MGVGDGTVLFLLRRLRTEVGSSKVVRYDRAYLSSKHLGGWGRRIAKTWRLAWLKKWEYDSKTKQYGRKKWTLQRSSVPAVFPSWWEGPTAYDLHVWEFLGVKIFTHQRSQATTESLQKKGNAWPSIHNHQVWECAPLPFWKPCQFFEARFIFLGSTPKGDVNREPDNLHLGSIFFLEDFALSN